MNATKIFAAATLALTLGGCGDAQEQDDLVIGGELTRPGEHLPTGPDENDLGAVSSALRTSPPAKFTGWVLIGPDSFWGSWRQEVYCNEGWYAIGFSQRVEGSQGSGDDTALNSVRLRCKQKVGGQFEDISSHDGWWGFWGSQPSCPGGDTNTSTNWINGARIKIEPSQGSSDDTGGNAVQMTCSGGHTLQTNNEGPWGTFGSYRQCPSGQVVCGLSIKLESMTTKSDDTSMNDIKLACCNL